MALGTEVEVGRSQAVAVEPPRLRRGTGSAPPAPPSGPDGHGGGGGGGGSPWVPGGPKAWFKRRGVLLGAAVGVVLAVTVFIDLPQHTTLAADAHEEQTVIHSITADLSDCNFAVTEGFKIFRDASGALSAANRAKIPGLLRDDIAACSFTDQSTYDLANIEAPGTVAGRDISAAVSTLGTWTTSDALGALTEISNLLTTHPSAVIAGKERAELARFERYGAEDRAKVMADVAAASAAVHQHLQPPPVSPMPLGT